MSRGRPCLIILASLCLAAAPSRARGDEVLTLRPYDRDLGETPIVAPLPKRASPGTYTLEAAGGRSLPCLVFEEDGKTYLGVVLDRVRKGQGEQFTLRPAPAGGKSNGVGIVTTEGVTRIEVGGALLTELIRGPGTKPYFFPVVGPTGAPYTRAYPMADLPGEDRDHPHQRSLWFTHGKVNGVDFWSEMPGHGSIRETSCRILQGGPAVGVIRTTDDWLDSRGKKVCEDERAVSIYGTKAVRILDFDVVVKATAGPVTFGDTKEGMFGLRVASTMDVKRGAGGKIVNAEGLTDGTAWGKASPWVDYTGPVAGKTVGVAILDHPDSFRHPTTWHVRDYGLFAANPFGWHDFGRAEAGDHTIPAGGTIRFRYRVILHEGDTAAADVAAAYAAFAHPPVLDPGK